MENNVSMEDYCSSPIAKIPLWIYVVKIVMAVVIITANIIVFLAIIKNWKTLMRQHNHYRYVMSLVAADLMNGAILFLHSVFWIAMSISADGENFSNENVEEVLRNLITGVIHGLTFASLASAALLNLVLRVASTRALARAAAIKSQSRACLRGISWVRSPRITIGLIGVIWIVTLVFVVFPLRVHCESGYQQCINVTSPSMACYVKRNGSIETTTEDCECSILRRPTKRNYVLTLNAFIALAWFLMLICNFFTTCIKTEVQKSTVAIEGKSNLYLTHSFGITYDSSSFFAFVITLNMTLATLPFIIFTFITESGPPSSRVHYAMTVGPISAGAVEMLTYLSSIVNPFIYTSMLSRLRSDVSRILKRRNNSAKKRIKPNKDDQLLEPEAAK